MSSKNNSNGNGNDNAPKDASNPPNESKQIASSNLPEGYRIPYAVQIGAVSTVGDIMSGKATFKLQHTMESPTTRELLDFVRASMEETDASPSAPVHKEIPAPAIELPNNGYPEGTCAGCGAENGESGGALRQCAKCKGRKYCGRKCQKADWPRHRFDCVESSAAGGVLP